MSPLEDGFPLSDEVLAVARRAADRKLCPECFGRIFGRAGHGLSNPARAEAIAHAIPGLVFAEGPECPLCGGNFHRWDVWLRRAREAAKDYEWHSFTCGCRWDPETLAQEESLWTEVASPWGESARGAFNRELGKRLSAATGAEGTVTGADLVFLADLPAGRVAITVNPMYFEGRYRKLDRTLPQTRWPCRRCRGRGCSSCGGSGKTYSESVEELVAAPILAVSQGEGTRFHGMGREDIDARMLGQGRPFVLEILRPRVRTLDLTAMREELGRTAAGRVEVVELRPTSADAVVRVKEANPWKSYRVTVRGEVAESRVLEILAQVPDRPIEQRTPTRVVHRRADRVRTRRIAEARLVSSEVGRFTVDLRAEAGTYIKEWVDGDGGRTEPSLSALLGVPLSVEALDVLEIHDQGV
jgi:tRNA pseudouridine synthase 10